MKSCSAPDCDFVTPVNCPTWELYYQLLSLHTSTVHPPPAAAPGAPAPRLERLLRPVFTLNMTEASWDFRLLEWRSYIEQTYTSPDNKLLQLRAACDDGLYQRVYDIGDYVGLDTENKFLARMKALAVIKIHKSVHLVNLMK